MTEKRYRVYQKGNYFAINDDIGEVAVISCIRTEIEAEWLCDKLNELNDENEQLKQELSIREDQIQQITVAAYTDQYKEAEKYRKKFIRVCDELAEDEITIGNLKKENEKLKEENEKYKQSNREAIKIVERYNRLLKELGYDN